MLNVVTGNIFTSSAKTLVNTVNCVGVMGAGLALECRLRYPEMFARYQLLCEQGRLGLGDLWLYKSSERWILNFPTKFHWRDKSKESSLQAGLKKFVASYREKNMESVAFPLLGGQHGGLPEERILNIMGEALSVCDIPITVYRYDASAQDDVFTLFKSIFLSADIGLIKDVSGLGTQKIMLLRAALEKPEICQLNQLASCYGIGDKTLEKSFMLARIEGVSAMALAKPQQVQLEI